MTLPCCLPAGSQAAGETGNKGKGVGGARSPTLTAEALAIASPSSGSQQQRLMMGPDQLWRDDAASVGSISSCESAGELEVG